MSEEDVERLLREAFDRQARGFVGEHRLPPPARFAETDASAGRRRRVHLLAPVAAAAAVIAVVVGVSFGLFAVGNGSGPDRPLALPHRTSSRTVPASPASDGTPVSSASVATPASGSVSAIAGRPVHIRLLNEDGKTYGVGMPVVAYFSRQFPDAHELDAATTVTVNGVRTPASWYFERSSSDPAYPVEGHLRPRDFWPAHAQVTVTVPARGLPAGAGYAFADGVQLSFHTGPRQIALVDDSAHRLTLTRDGHPIGSYPVSLGGPSTPTMRGTKVVMGQGTPLCLSGAGYRMCGIRYTQQLSSSGEYLIAAPWNVNNIERGIDSSNGCTDLLPADARTLYRTMRVGDLVEYPNTSGPRMAPGVGFGDWDVPWRVWRTGGLIPTR